MAALLTSGTQAEAAKKAGVSDRLIRQYLAEEDFNAELTRRRREAVGDATRAMQIGLQAAVAALREIVEESDSASARIQAARALLEYGLRYGEFMDVLDYVERLERIVEGQKQ